MPDTIDLSIVIVTWNSDAEIGGCLNSIIENTHDIKYEIIIVDNNSSDRTVDVIKLITNNNSFETKIILEVNKSNTGFTKGCNRGIELSSGRNVLLLNPDTVVKNNSLKLLLDKLESDVNTGAAAPQLLNPDMRIQKSCRTFPTYFDMFCEFSLLSYIFPGSKTLSRWKMNYFSHDKEEAVEQPMAAALMIKRKVLEKIDNFDERYEMFFNDVDLCRKIYDKGFEIIFYPESKIIHEKGVSIYKRREKMIRVWNDDCLKYFKKYDYNFFLYNWLFISLKISVLFRILIYKLKK